MFSHLSFGRGRNQMLIHRLLGMRICRIENTDVYWQCHDLDIYQTLKLKVRFPKKERNTWVLVV